MTFCRRAGGLFDASVKKMSGNFKKDGSLHKGHRERMRNKLINHGVHIFETYELFEMLLYYVVRYRDTNDIAKRLFLKYKTADRILSSSKGELALIDGIGMRCAELISLVGEAQGMLDVKGTDAVPTVLDTCETAGKYLLEHYKGETENRVTLILLDNQLALLKCITMYNEPFSSAAIKPEDFVNKALQNHASVALIAFNHPYGPNVEMPAEHETLKSVTEALRDSGVILPEVYLIVGQKYVALEKSYKYKTFMQRPDISGFCGGRPWNIPVFRSSPYARKVDLSLNSSRVPMNYIKALLSFTVKEPCLTECAERLINKYGTLRGVMDEPADCLARDMSISLTDALLIKLVAYVTSRRISEKLIPKRVYSAEELSSCITALFLGADVEEIYALLLDKNGALISCEFLGAGSVNSSGFVPRVLLDISSRYGAKSVILAHNHPSGTTKPSDEDFAITSSISISLLNLGVTLIDHYIVAGGECKAIQLTPGNRLITE